MARINSVLPRLWLKCDRVRYGKNLVLGGWPMIFRFPQAKITIGDNCKINSNFFSNLIGLYQRTILVARGTGEIVLGNHVGISGTTIYARERIEIGDYSIIGANCKIFDNDFHSLDTEERKNDVFDNLVTRPVTIGKNVFVGCNTIILKGTVIGDDCVIGAGSVVHGVFEAGCTIAGNPARIIKRREG
ncbi:MAG: acyltransferase [Lachnospiraceae bacterium]|nr:acyltransferase [Lachnospiraceae bacterium]